jgi:hypothetical protein
MKKIHFAILIALCCAFAACYKDKGNYNYHPVNQLTFTNFDTAKGYTVNVGQTLSITPQLKGTLDPDGSGKQYSYEWSLDFPQQDSVLSKEKTLNVKLVLAPGKYTLQYKVTDLSTGIQFSTRAQLLVTTRVFEGYLVMNEVNGKTRLDMVSYSRTDDHFEFIPDVLSQMSSALPVQGKPIQVFCFETEAFRITPQTYRIYLVTETGTYKIDPETFGYGPLDDFSYEMTGVLPATFKPAVLTGALQYGFEPAMFMTEGNDIYRRTYEGVVFPNVPVNIYAGDSKPFKAFPQVACNDDVVVIYNMDKRIFTSSSFAGINVTDMPPDLDFPEGKDMVYMEDQTNGYGYAVLKDPGLANYYLLRFYPGFGFQDYFDPITATDIDKATHFAVSPELGYLFYSVGGKLYEYDPFLHKSFLMMDKGTAEITFLSFQKFFSTSGYDKYIEFGNLLTVGSLDPAGAEGSNGTLERFSIPPLNASLQRKDAWTGFGRIASVSYRERN